MYKSIQDQQNISNILLAFIKKREKLIELKNSLQLLPTYQGQYNWTQFPVALAVGSGCTHSSGGLKNIYSCIVKNLSTSIKNSDHHQTWFQKYCVGQSFQNFIDTRCQNCMVQQSGGCLCQQTASNCIFWVWSISKVQRWLLNA